MVESRMSAETAYLSIYISYRREDAAASARRLYDALSEQLHPGSVSMDPFSPGVDDTLTIEDAIARSNCLLAIIGPEWLAPADPSDRRALDDPADPVRLEIEAALEKGLRVIPILVQGAVMPRAAELQASLRPLAHGQAFELNDDRFEADVERLVAVLSAQVTPETPSGEAVVDAKAPVTAPEEQPTAVDVESPLPLIDQPSPPLYVEENVQFTVYRPRSVQSNRWSTLLAFAHLSERRPDADPDEPDPLEEVRRQAEQVLGQDLEEFVDLTQDSAAGVPREGEITFLPTADKVTFNPPSRTFRWLETVHREEFRLRARGSVGEMLRGRLSIFLGVRLLAEIPLQLRVAAAPEPKPAPFVEHARPYRRIFASYSHRDVQIAEQFERYAAVFGDRYLRDWIDLRAGENWSERLRDLIRQADVFQLFWSWNSMRSENVRHEWEYALSLGRPNFVRPTYWEVPMPRDPATGLPSPALSALHFHRLSLGPLAAPPPPAPAPVQDVHLPRSHPQPEPGLPSRSAARSRLPLLIVIALTLLAAALAVTLAAPPPGS